jgi:hypothetical protein
MKDWPRYVPKQVSPQTEEKIRSIFERMKGTSEEDPAADSQAPDGADTEADKAA